MEKSVIFIEQPNGNDKPVEFTHYLNISTGWETASYKPSEQKKIIYLGNCCVDGDMFAAYRSNGEIFIYKGHLNSGRY